MSIWSSYNPFKNLNRRIVFWMVFYAFFILMDEWLKEGYLISPGDFLKPGTHEFLLLLGESVMLISLLVIRKKYGKNSR